MTIATQARQIFKVAETKDEVICPPDQIFINPNFVFSVTIGGHLTDDDKEYQKLMNLFKGIGETEFNILENIGATLTERNIPFHATIPISENFEYFDSIGRSFDSDFGFLPYSFFIFGKNKNWGIYMCELPTINIIGCTNELAESFSKALNIAGNGFHQQVDFIAQEYHNNDLLDKFVKNYRLYNRME